MAELIVEERRGVALATIMARKRVRAGAIGAALGLDAPDAPGSASGDKLALIGTGPGTWLAIADPAPAGWMASLRERLDGLASVSDQSGGYVILRLSGRDARMILQRGIAIDLDPRSFRAGSSAVTTLAQVGVVLRRLDDGTAYDLLAFRSYATSLQAWLDFAMAAGE